MLAAHDTMMCVGLRDVERYSMGISTLIQPSVALSLTYAPYPMTASESGLKKVVRSLVLTCTGQSGVPPYVR